MKSLALLLMLSHSGEGKSNLAALTETKILGGGGEGVLVEWWLNLV